MLKAILKLLIGDNGASSDGAAAVKVKSEGGLQDLEHFVDYVVRALVDAPDAVRISSESTEEAYVIKIDCKKEDIGKIVGRRGKTIMAIRSLVSGAAGRQRKRVSVEVLD